LDEIDPQTIRKAFLDIFHELQRGKLLEEYRFLDESYLCLVDGSGIFENVYILMLGGRSRWKVENETFNTLKNQGYQFEHNFGHGRKNLHTVFAFLMMLAFLIDQVQEAACGIFREAIKCRGSRRAFWERMRSVFHLFFIKSWEDMFVALGPQFKGKFLDTL